ncbi:MAG TPA: GNAT family N-acetyltransferase [Bryobacteraceae bacterium]
MAPKSGYVGLMALGPGDIVSQCMKEGDLRLEFLEFVTHPVHKAPAYYFRMVHALTGEKLGGINLRVGSTPHLELYAGHVGYSVEPAHQGHRYAARSLRLLIPIAQQLGFEALWITCDPENAGSQRSAELAGAEFVEIVDVPEHCIIHQSGHKQKCRYRLAVH